MSDSAFKTGRYPAYTITELKAFIHDGRDHFGHMAEEIKRREAVAAGDKTQMTPGERLRHARAH